ncbi:hypothetical protein [Nostoc sp. UHCC 0252]|nr:hypothetical protein [Nostoc sp. UHCC 0252]MEA5606221.1 hypothetical protein [Nostoc sp. UHCC 0252]
MTDTAMLDNRINKQNQKVKMGYYQSGLKFSDETLGCIFFS